MTSEVLTKLWKYKKQLEVFLKRNEDDKVRDFVPFLFPIVHSVLTASYV